MSNISVIFLCLLSYTIGWVASYFVNAVHKKRRFDGVLKVNTTNPEKDVFSFELNCALGELVRKSTLYFKVENESSQEKPSA